MIKDFVPAEHKTAVSYDLNFFYDEYSGVGFPCDADGNVLPFKNDDIRKNYEYCMAHPEKFKTFAKVTKYVSHYTEPAHGTCSCGTEVELFDQYYGASQCPNCGQWYNLFGQSLLPPEQWEEEYW